MRNPFARFLAPKAEQPQAKPKGKYASANKRKFELFNDRKKDLAKFETIYKQGGMVTEAINTYPLYILTNGYRFEGEDEGMVQKVEDKCEEIDLEACIYQGVVDALVFGDGYQEIAPSKTEDVGMVFPRPAITFETKYDEFGVVTGFEQTVEEGWSKGLPIPFAPEEILHIVLNRVGGSPTGISLIARCYDEIIRDARIAESSAAAVERHGFPKYHIKVGVEGEDIPKEDMLSIANQFQDLQAKNEFVTVHDVDIASIDTQSMNIQDYGNWTVQRLCSALGVPEEMLGLGRGSTEATANVRLQAFYDKISTYQKRVARIYNLQLIDKITGQPGSVKLVFNDVSPVDEELKARWIAQIMGATPGDPFAILPQEWVQQQFDIDPEQYEIPEEQLDEGLMGEELLPENQAEEQGAPSSEDAFSMPELEYFRDLDAHSAACKAAQTRGDKLGPECGGSEEASKKRPTKKPEEPTGKKKIGSAEEEAKRNTLFTRSEASLSEEGKKNLNFLKENRQKIGYNKYNHVMGKTGEQIIFEIAKRYNAHTNWNTTQDLGNTKLFDVKTLNPKSKSTPIQWSAWELKIAEAQKQNKKWAFPIVQPSEDRVDLYLHEAKPEFYKPKKKGEQYNITIEDAEYLGYFDKNNVWHDSTGKDRPALPKEEESEVIE